MLKTSDPNTTESSSMDMLPLAEPASAPVAFDYTAMDADAAREARAAVERYRGRSKAYVMDTGRDLLAIKARLEHGLFLLWIKAELGLEPRTAQNFMQAAERFEGKSEIVSHLPPTVLYKLAAPSTPEPVRAAVLKRIEAGETVQANAIVEEIREAKDEAARRAKAEKEEARRAALTPEQREEEDALNAKGEKGRVARERRADRERERQRQQQLEERRAEEREAVAAARFLLDNLGVGPAAAFCARFGPNYGQALQMLAKLALVEQSHDVDAIEIDKAEIVLVGYTANWGSEYWDDREEVQHLAEEIRRDGLSEPIVVVEQTDADRRGRGRYRIVDGSRRFRAVTVLLQRPSILARVAPPADPLALSDG